MKTKKSDNQEKLVEQITQIFDQIDDYSRYKERLTFTVRAGAITFDRLAQLSELLKTRCIDLGHGYSKGCDTCGYGGGSYIAVTCTKVKTRKT